jgi:hypothetical protein
MPRYLLAAILLAALGSAWLVFGRRQSAPEQPGVTWSQPFRDNRGAAWMDVLSTGGVVLAERASLTWYSAAGKQAALAHMPANVELEIPQSCCPLIVVATTAARILALRRRGNLSWEYDCRQATFADLTVRESEIWVAAMDWTYATHIHVLNQQGKLLRRITLPFSICYRTLHSVLRPCDTAC